MSAYASTSQPILEGSQAGNLELGTQAVSVHGGMSAAYWCTLHGLLTLLAFICPGVALLSELSPPTQIKKMYHRLFHRPV